MPKGIYEPIGVGSGSGGGGSGGGGRTILTGNLSLYVDAATGSDSYNGLSATFTGGVNGPKATLQDGWDTWSGIYDLAQFSATINLAAGSYTLNALASWVNGTGVFILGAGSGSTTISDGFIGCSALPGGISIDSVTLYSTGINQAAFDAGTVGVINIGLQTNDIIFDTTGDLSGQSFHLYMQGLAGTTVVFLHGGTFVGDGAGCIFADQSVLVFSDGDVVFSGTPNVTQTVFVGNDCFVELAWNSVTGGVTTTFPTQVSAGGFLKSDTAVPIPSSQSETIIFRGGGWNDAVYQTIVAPSSGDTVSFPNLYSEQFLVIDPSGPLTTLTVEVPAAWAIGYDGMLVDISTTRDIASLSIVTTEGGSGVSVVALPSSLSAGSGIRIVFDFVSKSWYPAVSGEATGGGGSTKSAMYVATFWYFDYIFYAAAFTGFQANAAYFQPVWIGEPITIEAFAASIGTGFSNPGGGAQWGMGIYDTAAGANVPNNLLASIYSTSAATGVVELSLASSHSITTPGWYWLAFLYGDTTQTTNRRSDQAIGVGSLGFNAPIGVSSANLSTTSISTRVQTTTGFVLPATASGVTEAAAFSPWMAYQVVSVP